MTDTVLSLRNVRLSDVFDVLDGPIFMRGKQALSRVPLLQRELDRRRGLSTAGYITGYRGSPLGTLDTELLKIADRLQASNVVFEPGLNEDLAMTAVWGTQQLDFVPGRRYDGVFAMWYAKGPGVDRSGDAIKHTNMAGTHPNGGVLLVFGDDHVGKSSSLAHQSDLALAAHEVPILYPSDIKDILRFGLAGIALSREAGLLVGLKLVNETADGTQVMRLSLDEITPVLADSVSPADVSARPEMLAGIVQDQRMIRAKLPRVHAFTRRNAIDRVVFGASQPTSLGIVTAGKAFADVMDALRRLGIDHATACRLGIGVLKVGLIFPLDPQPLTAFAAAAKELVFVEEKRPHMESQVATLLYHLPRRPDLSGKHTPDGRTLLPADAALDAVTVALALGRRILAVAGDNGSDIRKIHEALDDIAARAASPGLLEPAPLLRRPVFCSGCPHNRSTKLPDGSLAVAGVGCHGLVQFMDRCALPSTPMGAEGTNWIGLSHFTDTKHMFVNLGDGTYSHSGSLAIRAAASAQANVTFKILVNGTVAMTGGQPIESGLSVGAMAHQVLLDGARRVVVVAEDPKTVRAEQPLPPGVPVVDRRDIEKVQTELRETPGTTAIIYVQVCATEKRRRRKRGTAPAATTRVVINPAVCDGCDDCSRAANCMSVQPLETELGRKRRIDQSSCNVDLSCLEGVCPSFATIERARARASARVDFDSAVARLPTPTSALPRHRSYGLLLAGIGGTGVVTVSAILGMAAHLEGRGASVCDMTGLAQKGGAVLSHLRLCSDSQLTAPLRLGLEDADLVIAADLVAATQSEALRIVSPHAVVVADDQVRATQRFHDDPNIDLDAEPLLRHLESRAGRVIRIAATELAQSAFGDTIGANMILVGAAFQSGALPLAAEAIEQAIRLNGTAVDSMLQAFRLGRLRVADGSLVKQLMSSDQPVAAASSPLATLQDRILLRTQILRDYQNDAYAGAFERLVDQVRAAEGAVDRGSTRLTEAVMVNAFKLMAYKDEYEVARLWSDPAYWDGVRREFDGGAVTLHFAPPIFGRRSKMALSARRWLPALRLLARGKILRGTVLDPFVRMDDRRLERRVRDEYLDMVAQIASTLDRANLEAAVALARYPDEIRGFGHVKAATIKHARAKIDALKARFLRDSPQICGSSSTNGVRLALPGQHADKTAVHLRT